MKDEIKDKIIELQDELIEHIKSIGMDSPFRSDELKYIRLFNSLATLKSQLAKAGEENSCPCKSCGKVFKESELNEYTFNDDRCSEFYCNECDAGGRQPR